MRSYLCAACVATLVGSVARADVIFGINAGPSGGGIYAIDTSTGIATPYRATPSVGTTDDANGLAYNDATDTFYYVNRTGGVNRMVRNAATGETDLGAMASNGVLDSGTFYNGYYWSHGSSSIQVLRVAFAGPSFSEVPFTVPGFPANANFGDIASLANGVTYASFSNTLRRYDLDTPAAGSVLISMGLQTMQLAFGPTGLWGIRGSNIYSINTTTGGFTLTSTLANGSLQFIDLAPAPAPGSVGLLAFSAGVLFRRRR